MAAMDSVAFRMEGVRYCVGHSTILDDITLDVPYGRLLALVGPNGAGKSTLLGMLMGDQQPTRGSVSFNGRPLDRWNAKELSRQRAVLLQQNQVAFAFTVAEVVEMGRAPWAGTASAADDEELMRQAVASADIDHLLDRSFPSLSGGEKARASLARVLAQNTPVVMLDEPTAALDLRHQEDVLRIARDLAHAGHAVVVVLHDLSLAAAYADDIAMIDQGQLVALGSPHEVLTQQRIQDVYGTSVRIIIDEDTGRPIVLPRRSPAGGSAGCVLPVACGLPGPTGLTEATLNLPDAAGWHAFEQGPTARPQLPAGMVR